MRKKTSKYKKYKDSVFCMLFSDKNKLRNLYNAITNSSYSRETPIIINTLRDFLGIGLRNDISFTIDNKTIVLKEHQSTVNPNMPVRLLFYISAIFEKMIQRKELYGEKEIELPDPDFYLFYNGKGFFPDKKILLLSNSFKNSKRKLELEVTAYNVNARHNKILMEKSRDLGEYALFVEKVREKEAGLSKKESLEEAFRLAIKECIEHNILREFLEKHKEEVVKSLLNITREEYIEIRLEAAQEKGSMQARLETAQKLKNMGLSFSQISEATGLSLEEIEKL